MRLIDFERFVLSEIYDEEIFEEYLERNILNIEEELDHHRISEKTEFEHFEVSTLEYLEEISKIGFYSDEYLMKELSKKGIEVTDDVITKSLRIPVYCGMLLLKEGMDYLDLMQEGSIGLIEAIKSFPTSGYKSLEEYAKIKIMRRMIIFTNERLCENKAEFIRYFENIKEEYEERGDVIEEVDRKIENINEMTYLTLHNVLSEIELKVLERYYGLKEEKRASIFEIEELLNLEKGKGEEIFQICINKISKFGGEFFSI